MLTWRICPASLLGFFVRHSKITKLFQVSQLSSDFFWVSSIFPASFRYSLRLFSLFSFSFQSLLVFSASLVSASLFFLLSVFSLFIFFYSISSSLSHLSISISSISISSSSLVLYCVLFFSFSSLSHLTFPAYLSLLSHYPLIDSEQCDNRFSWFLLSSAVQFVRGNPPFSGQVVLIFSYLSVEPYLLPDKFQ